MKRTWATWTAVAGLVSDAISVFVLAPAARFLQLVDDAHDTDREGDEP